MNPDWKLLKMVVPRIVLAAFLIALVVWIVTLEHGIFVVAAAMFFAALWDGVLLLRNWYKSLRQELDYTIDRRIEHLAHLIKTRDVPQPPVVVPCPCGIEIKDCVLHGPKPCVATEFYW